MHARRQRSVVAVLCIALVLGGGVVAGGVGSTPTNETGAAQASASITIDNQFNDGLSVDVANYDLGSNGVGVSIWSVSNGSADTWLGYVNPTNDTGSVSVDLARPISDNQTVLAAVHTNSGIPNSTKIVASDTASVIVQRSASLIFNDQTSDGRNVDLADFDLGTDGESVAVWSISNGSPDELLGNVSPNNAIGTTSITLDDPVTSNQTLAAAVHSGAPRADNVLTVDTASIVVEPVPATITFNDQTTDGRSVEIADHDLGTRGETLAVWSTSNSSLLDQLLGSTSPSRLGGNLKFLNLRLTVNRTLAAAVHSGPPRVDNVLTVDTATVTVNATLSVGGNPPARNIDSDPLLEDVDGDGSANVFDAIELYNHRNSQVVQNNPQAFDFDGDGTVNVFDAIELYNEVKQL